MATFNSKTLTYYKSNLSTSCVLEATDSRISRLLRTNTELG